MNTSLALIIPADMNEPARVESTPDGLPNLQSIVAGKEGKTLRLEPNRRAALLVVFLGETADGSEGNVPGHLIDLAQQLFALNQPANQ